MIHLYKITHRTASFERTVAVEARSADEAQELFIDHCESAGVAHGVIVGIRVAAGA